MKKRDLLSLATLAVTATFLLGACQSGNQKSYKNEPEDTRPGGGGSADRAAPMSSSVQRFYNTLSPESKKKFDQLDDQHRTRALESSKQTRDANKAVDEQYKDQMKDTSRMSATDKEDASKAISSVVTPPAPEPAAVPVQQ